MVLCWLLFPVLAALKVPQLTGPVVDLAGVLSSSETAYIEQTLRGIHARGKAQIQVLIVSTLEGEAIEQFSIRVVDKWRLGTEQADNGVLFLVALKDRKMRIEVGQGLEGDLTDLHSRRILDEMVRPLFREQRYADGVLAGISGIVQRVDPEAKMDSRPFGWADLWAMLPPWPFPLFLLVILFVFGSHIFYRIRYGKWYQPPQGSSWHSRGGGGSGWGGGSSSWGGGGGGGSWGGGGGGFSGGGSSGSW